MFNLFKRKNKQPDENDSISAQITLTINDVNDVHPTLNVYIKDYSDDSILSLCSLVQLFGSKDSKDEALDIIKTFFQRDGEDEAFAKINNIITFIDASGQKVREKSPCIKPSDLMKYESKI